MKNQITISNEVLTYAFTSEKTFAQILDSLLNPAERLTYLTSGTGAQYLPRRVYRVIDNAVCVLTTLDETKALHRPGNRPCVHEEVQHVV